MLTEPRPITVEGADAVGNPMYLAECWFVGHTRHPNFGWSAVDCPDRSWCPPDLTRPQPDVADPGRVRVCGASLHGYARCTRGPKHTARHAAGDGTHIVAVWP